MEKESVESTMKRVSYYEGLMQEIKGMVSAKDSGAGQIIKIQDHLKELKKYYISLDWMNDFEKDEAGLLPVDLKRGVLSEDGVDHLLDDVRDWADGIIENMRKKQSWIIDILPQRVPEENRERYFKIEQFYLSDPNIYEIRRKHADIILKINCYYSIYVNNGDFSLWMEDPECEDIYRWVIEGSSENAVNVIIPSEDTLLVLNGDDTHMTVYNAPQQLFELISRLSIAEGLFIWLGKQED